MNWTRYSGRILLALGVVGVALWATHQKLIDIPVYHFWLGILCYLIAAEVVWTLVERATAPGDERRAAGGLFKLPRRQVSTLSPNWLYDGGRVRLADLAAQNDIVRDAHQGLLTAVLTREPGLRLHLLCGDPGTGRSTMLLRVGRALADQDQTVFVGLPGPDLERLLLVVEAARKRQTYLLLDDLDLRPQAEAWLYELQRTGLPIVVIATVCKSPQQSLEYNDLALVQPASLLSTATVHVPSLTANDLAALTRKLSALVRQQRWELGSEVEPGFVGAMRQLQGRAPGGCRWSDLDQGPSLPLRRKVMVALCGAAELALPVPLAAPILGKKTLSRWQRARLVAVEQGLILPPHRDVCLSLLENLEDPSEAAAALEALVKATPATDPQFVIRLLFGLANVAATAPLARQVAASGAFALPEQCSDGVRRLWRHVLEQCGLPCAVAVVEIEEQYPPEIARLARRAYEREDYQQALELSHQLASNAVYQAVARFNLALILSRLGRLQEAAQQLADHKAGPPGTHFLRGVIAESKGDYLAALDAFETSRKADELQPAATLRLAFCYLRTGSPRSAIPLFESVLVQTPLRAEVYGGLAVAHQHAGMTQRAAAQSARAIQAGVDPLQARRAVARACAEHHAFDRAAAELEACVNYDPTDVSAWRELASACRWRGRFEREEECLKRVQLADPDNLETRFQRARCERDRGRAEETLSLLAPVLSAQPTVAVLLLAAEAAGACDDPQRQRQYAREALAGGDDSGWGHYWLAEGLPEAEEEQRTAYEAAISLLKSAATEGATPRRGARLWQAIHQAATRLGDDGLAVQASRKARQEALVCEALGAEIESVTHRRSVPTDVFLEGFASPTLRPPEPPATTRETPRVESPVVEMPAIRPRVSGMNQTRGQ